MRTTSKTASLAVLTALIALLDPLPAWAYEFEMTTPYLGEFLSVGDQVRVDVFLDAEPGLTLFSLGVLYDSAELEYSASDSAAAPASGPAGPGAQPSYILYTGGKAATILYPDQTPAFMNWPAPPPGSGQVNINYSEPSFGSAAASGTGIWIATLVFNVVGQGDGQAPIELCNTCGGNVIQTGVGVVPPEAQSLLGDFVVNVFSLLTSFDFRNGAEVLFVSDSNTDTNISNVLVGDGHFVTNRTNDWSAGENAALQQDLSSYDVVVWSATGDGQGGVHTVATTDNVADWVNAGGRLFVTGFDAIVDPADPNLVSLLGGASSVDNPPEPPTPILNRSNFLTFGVGDIRGLTPSGGSANTDALGGLGADTVVVVGSGSTPNHLWTLRNLGAGQVAFVSNGEMGGPDTPSWETESAAGDGVFNAALRNFVAGGAVLFDIERSLPSPVAVDLNQGVPLNIPLSVLDEGVIRDVNTFVRLTGVGQNPDPETSWDDLEITLSKGGTTVVLNGDPQAASLGAFQVLFDDEAESSISDAKPGDAAGRFRPDGGMLSSFDGEELAGDWTLTITETCCVGDTLLAEWRISVLAVIDSDGDGVDDILDELPLDPFESVDTDGDGVGDNADAFPTDPDESADDDVDGVGDNGDNCAGLFNPLQSDTDSDGLGDLCDNAPDDFNPDQRDGDGDGVGDAGDNCPTIQNASQVDSFGLSDEGDACEGLVPLNVLLVSDLDGEGEIATALQQDGHSVTNTILDFSNGTNTVLSGDLSSFDAVYWSASGAGSGAPHNASTLANLTSFAMSGGRVFVTGFNALTQAAGGDPALVDFLGGTIGIDGPASGPFSPVVNEANNLTVGRADLRGLVLSSDGLDADLLGGLQPGVVGVVSSGSPPGFAWTIRPMGSGFIVWVSNGSAMPPTPSWADSSDGAAGAYNAAARNFAVKIPDFDSDGVANTEDAFPADPTETMDSDSDGVGDNGDNCPSTPNFDQTDTDGDGAGNICDPDVDGDGLPNGDDSDVDGDGVRNSGDVDVDGDRLLNPVDGDVDGDGVDNASDPDADGDGIPNGSDPTPLPELAPTTAAQVALVALWLVRVFWRPKRR